MNITIEKIDPNNKAQAEEYCSWIKNETMLKNWFLQKEDDDSEVSFTEEDFEKAFSNEDKIAFMIKDDKGYFGYGSFFINHPVGKFKEGRVCWPSLGIGKDSHRGRGLSKHLCEEIARLAKQEGCTHIEAAVFEFNEPIKNILVKAGFKYIGKEEKKTFVDGKWWDSEHYLLKLIG
jgi:RimJ/RimL family protein N-acetyltransferase